MKYINKSTNKSGLNVEENSNDTYLICKETLKVAEIKYNYLIFFVIMVMVVDMESDWAI